MPGTRDVIGTSNLRLLSHLAGRKAALRETPELFFPWRRPCTIKALLVTDGGLDFGPGDFGLSTFVDVLLNDGRSYARFDLTVAHLRPGVSDAAVMAGAPGITRSIKGLRFDEPTHFKPTMYDEVWLFGIETNFHNGSYPPRAADPGRYPAASLGVDELKALADHMNRGGGIFATGDHGYLGNALCGSITRVRSMRAWQDFTGPTGENEVSMSGARRNDSNQPGSDGLSQFSDQSDDIPQPLDLKLYSTPIGTLGEVRYPHPVMCSRLGRIDVFPDHPHEGECHVPTSLAETYLDGSQEYPDALDGSGPLSPELIASGRVRSGNTAALAPFGSGSIGTKTPTQAHSFGVVTAYDGHRCASAGRVVCDSTWHHFVNVNLIGVVEGGFFDDLSRHGNDPAKHDGFLSTPSGRSAFDKIKEYFVNVGVWIAPAALHRCFDTTLWWELLWSDRIVEAALLTPDVDVTQVPLKDLLYIGSHARDVIGRRAGACQALVWTFIIIDRVWPEIRPWIDPWTRLSIDDEVFAPLPVIDLQPLVDAAIGGAVVAARQAFPYFEAGPNERNARLDDAAADKLTEVAYRGAREAVAVAQEDLRRTLGRLSGAL